MTGRRILLYGAAGHTGAFISGEIARRGWEAVLAGRDMDKLAPIAARHGLEARQVEVTDRSGLDSLLAGADAVINAAGPFADTAPALIEAALRARIPYLDVTAEPFVAKQMFEAYAEPAHEAGTIVAPAFGFFGALGDLLVSAALGDWTNADTVDLAFALDRWQPTRGTRLAGARRAGRRLIRTRGKFEIHEPSQPVPRRQWTFGPPFGQQPMAGEFSTVDVVTITRHIPVPTIGTWINEAPLKELSDPATPGPQAADESSRSAQRFAIEAVIRRGSEERRARASGRDIYAITAPIVCQAAEWMLSGRARATGAASASELFDARAFLTALVPDSLAIQLPWKDKT
jgi:Saccharopine dehydrogenase NADP binding domain